MISAEIFIFLASLLIIKFLWQNRRYFYLASKIPTSDFDYSLKGIYKFLTADCKQLFELSFDSFKNTKGTVKTWLGPVLIIIVGSPQDAKIIFNSRQTIEKPVFMSFFGAPESILFGNYDSWHSHRKILNPFFNANGIKCLMPIFNEKVKIFMERVGEMEGKGTFDVFYYLTSLALETIMNVMDFDVDIQNLKKEEREAFIVNLRGFFKAVTLRIFKPWLHPDIIYKQTKIFADEEYCLSKNAAKFSYEICSRAGRNGTNYCNNNCIGSKRPHPKSFIYDLFKNNLSTKEIFEEIKTLLVAAQDTSANSSSSVLLLLAMNKTIQDKVAAELHQVFGKTHEAPYIDQDHINELKYLDMVINEAMRLLPVVPIVFRKVEDEVQLSDGIILPKRANIIVPIIKIHKDKNVWGDDAETFRPERFEKENLRKVHPYAFIPFTKGARMCLGYRYAVTLMKIQLANFLLKYEVDTNLNFEELEFELNTTMNVCQGYMISIKKRSL